MVKHILPLIGLFIIGGILAGMRATAFAEDLPKRIPVSVTADKLDYDRTNDLYTAEGHVRIEQQDIRLEADRVVLNNKTGDVRAEGNVYLRDKGDTLLSERIEVNLNTGAGVIYKGQLYKSKENFHLKGDRIERRSEPDPAEFLSNLCYKMGADPDLWRNKHLEVLVYQVEEFHEPADLQNG